MLLTGSQEVLFLPQYTPTFIVDNSVDNSVDNFPQGTYPQNNSQVIPRFSTGRDDRKPARGADLRDLSTLLHLFGVFYAMILLTVLLSGVNNLLTQNPYIYEGNGTVSLC